MARRQLCPVADEPELTLALATAEDTILQKLVWYRTGGEASERQWRDALGVLLVRGEALDRNYLWHWAEQLGCSDLLERLLRAPRGEA